MNSSIVSKIQSAAVSPQTRQVLSERLAPLAPHTRVFFSETEFLLLRKLIRAVVPDPSALDLQVAQQIETRLDEGEGAGWRFAALPPDPDAYRIALGLIVQQLSASAMEGDPSDDTALLTDLLSKAQGGSFDTKDFPMSLWFEGFKVDVIRFWLADPRTMELFRYDGFADQFAESQNAGSGGGD